MGGGERATIENCLNCALDEARIDEADYARLETDLARLRAVEAAARHLGRRWERLCRCVDEFAPGDLAACAEWREALDGAVEATIAALAE